MTSYNTIRAAVRLVGLGTAVFTAAGFASAAGVQNFGTNTATGYSSSNENTVSEMSTMVHNITNLSDAYTHFGGLLNTGHNTSNFNTSSQGAPESGMINVSGTVNNSLNSGGQGASIVVPEVMMPSVVSIGGSNNLTGAYSSNSNTTTIHQSTTQNITNSAHVHTTGNLDVNTGHNDNSFNTISGGSGSSGDITAVVNVNNTANSGAAANALVTMPVASSITSMGSNSVTGYNSDNKNVTNYTEKNTVDVKNTATIDTDFNLKANTGDNQSNFNTVGGGFNSGSINAGISVTNSGN